MRLTKTSLAAAFCLLCLSMPAAQGASVSKTYSYFSIGGTTLEEIEQELSRRGPHVQSTGVRHPGATRMEFRTRVTYGERNGRCGVTDAHVAVKADMILPRWKRRNRADAETRLIWDTLASDIKRHEEFHVTIARNHASELEQDLKAIRNQRGCVAAQEKVKQLTAAMLDRHDREQERFDRVEAINFESRLLGLIRYRMEQIDAAR